MTLEQALEIGRAEDGIQCLGWRWQRVVWDVQRLNTLVIYTSDALLANHIGTFPQVKHSVEASGAILTSSQSKMTPGRTQVLVIPGLDAVFGTRTAPSPSVKLHLIHN
jgi:hypothetical protein